MYVDLLPNKPIIKEIHLGGGTPTFFASHQLKKLIDGLFVYADRHADYEFSLEGHPNNTTKEQLQVLYDLGFTRISFRQKDDTYSYCIFKNFQKSPELIHPFIF